MNTGIVIIVLLVLFIVLIAGFIYDYLKNKSVIDETSDGRIERQEHQQTSLVIPSESTVSLPLQKQIIPNPLPAIDYEGLRCSYDKAVRKHRETLMWAEMATNLGFSLSGIGSFLLLMIIFTYLKEIQETLDLESAFWLFIIILHIGCYLATLIYYYRAKKKKVVSLLNSEIYIELNEKQFPDLWRACYKILGSMGLNLPLRIFYAKRDQIEASVILEDNTINLLLSRGIISYSGKNFKHVESIIGHELGHVYQGDTYYMIISRNVSRVPAMLTVLSLVITILTVSDSNDKPTISLMGLLNYWHIFNLYVGLIKHRKKAEYLADMASLTFVKDSAIKELVSSYMPKRSTLSYPSANQRTAFLDKWIRKFALADRT